MPSRTLSARSLRSVARHLALEPPGWLFSVAGSERQPRTRRERQVDDPVDLLGAVADDTWKAVALVLPGRSDHDGSSRQVTVCMVLDRSGQAVVAVRVGAVVDTIDASVGVSGLVADIAHRMLGLPSEPEATSPTLLIISVWLQNLLDAVADPHTAPSVTTWADAVGVHPAWRAGGGVFAAPEHPGPTDPDDIAALTVSLASHLSWERMRQLAAAGSIELPGLSPAEAAWMDCSFFARWTLDVHRPVTELLDDLSLFLDGPLLHNVRYTVQAVGWLGFADSTASWATGDE